MNTKRHIILLLIGGMVMFGCKSKKDGNASSSKDKEAAVVAEGLNLGNRAPEIELKNPSDSIIKLSSLRGKIVLIDFWAGWCGPCRFENKNVVRVYKKYKDAKLKNAKGFTVYSVSLDNTKSLWQKAIAADSLIWSYHVSDLMGWNSSAAVKYGVSTIPNNFLIDAKGVIIGRELRDRDLEKAIENLVVK